MSSEKNASIAKEALTQAMETSPRPLKPIENIILSVKLLIGGAAFMALIWFLDTLVTA